MIDDYDDIEDNNDYNETENDDDHQDEEKHKGRAKDAECCEEQVLDAKAILCPTDIEEGIKGKVIALPVPSVEWKQAKKKDDAASRFSKYIKRHVTLGDKMKNSLYHRCIYTLMHLTVQYMCNPTNDVIDASNEVDANEVDA
ncbi:hypothetical protein Tco_1423604 [Tanacetum coccineum]